MLDKLLPLLQLCDSNFPSGAFSHSFGFETYIYNEKSTTRKRSVRRFVLIFERN